MLASKALTAFLHLIYMNIQDMRGVSPLFSTSGTVHYTMEPLRIHRNHLDLAMTSRG